MRWVTGEQPAKLYGFEWAGYVFSILLMIIGIGMAAGLIDVQGAMPRGFKVVMIGLTAFYVTVLLRTVAFSERLTVVGPKQKLGLFKVSRRANSFGFWVDVFRMLIPLVVLGYFALGHGPF